MNAKKAKRKEAKRLISILVAGRMTGDIEDNRDEGAAMNDFPEKERERLLAEIRKGKIEVDNTYYVFTTDDGIIFVARGDFLPHQTDSIELEMDSL